MPQHRTMHTATTEESFLAQVGLNMPMTQRYSWPFIEETHCLGLTQPLRVLGKHKEYKAVKPTLATFLRN